MEQSQGYRGHTKWKKYKGKSGFILLIAKTTTIIRGIKDHAVDCYAELWHNGHQVAEAYGEAKNCPLIKEHIDTFEKWLAEFSYEPFPVDSNPPDLAFVISPSATDLQKRKLKIKGIEFIEEERIDDVPSDTKSENGREGNESGSETVALRNRISINTSSEAALKDALKDANFQSKTINKLIANRPYESFDDLVAKTKFGSSIQKKLKDKMNSDRINFD